MATLIPGLYGKLPGRGDFVRVGWDDVLVDALDHWLADGLAAWRPADDDTFAQHFSAVPLFNFFLPPGWLTASALHGVLSPSVDRAGRFFFLVTAVLGDAATVWHIAVQHGDFAAALEVATYAALGPNSDPEALAAAVTTAVPENLADMPWRARLCTPADAIFWAVGEGEPLVIRGPAADAALLATLLNVNQPHGDGE